MFERFSDEARRTVVLAQEEAKRLNHNYIGTEHILLGLLRDGENVAAKTLQALGITLEAVRQQVEEIIGRGKKDPSGRIPFTPRAKRVLELSLREAISFTIAASAPNTSCSACSARVRAWLPRCWSGWART